MRKTLTNVLLTFLILILGLGVAGFMTGWFTDFSLFTPNTSSDSSSDISSDASSTSVEEELSYNLTFTVATTNTVPLDGDAIKAIGSSDAQLMSYSATESLYRQAPNSIKFGSSSARGRLIFTIPDNLRILSVIVEAQAYGTDNTTLKVNDLERGLTSTSAAYEFDYEALETATVEITSKNTTSSRFYISSITIIHSNQPISEPEEPVYTRIELEQYEIQLPMTVNRNWVYGSIYMDNFTLEGFMISGFHTIINDQFGLSSYGDGSMIRLELATDDSAMTEFCEPFQIMPGEYGRYTVRTEQVAGQPVAFDYEPIYEYVLVD